MGKFDFIQKIDYVENWVGLFELGFDCTQMAHCDSGISWAGRLLLAFLLLPKLVVVVPAIVKVFAKIAVFDFPMQSLVKINRAATIAALNIDHSRFLLMKDCLFGVLGFRFAESRLEGL